MNQITKGRKVPVPLRYINVGLGWQQDAAATVEHDLDLAAFMIDASEKLPEPGFELFYGNLESPDKAVVFSGDNTTGGEGDSERLVIDVGSMDKRVRDIVIVASIFDAAELGLNFGNVKGAYVRVYDPKTDFELYRYELGSEAAKETCVVFGRLRRQWHEWAFEALGEGIAGGMDELKARYSVPRPPGSMLPPPAR